MNIHIISLGDGVVAESFSLWLSVVAPLFPLGFLRGCSNIPLKSPSKDGHEPCKGNASALQSSFDGLLV